MTKRQSRGILITLAIFILVAIAFLLSNVVKELYLGYLLIRSESLNEILFYVNNVASLSDIYVVSLVKSMSDVNITFTKFLQALEFRHVIAPVLLLLSFDLNRVYFKKGSLNVGLSMLFLSFILKYLIVIIIGIFITPSVMNPTILFEAVGFILILQQIFVVISVIILFFSVLSLVRKEDANVRIVE